MHTDTRGEIEAFIEKVIAPARAARPADPEAARAKAELAREDLQLAKRELVESGLDPERLDKLAAERSKGRKTLADEARRKTVDASAAAALRLADLLAVYLPAEPLETVIDEVHVIRSFIGQGTVSMSNIGPSDNWAQYRLEASSDGITETGTGRLSFFTIWQNKQNTSTIVMARPNFVVNAHLSCDASWNGVAAWFISDSEARATVRARTTVWSMASNVSSIVHDQVLGGSGAHGEFFGDDNSASIEFSQLLPASGVAVPPQAYILIEVELLTDWVVSGGSVTLDAKDGAHRVDLPYIVLTEIRTPEPPPPPPIALTAGVDTSTSPATVTLLFSGASGALVDIYQDGVRLGDTENDGAWSIQRSPGTYVFRVCERLSSVCSTEVSVTVTA